ncbi:uncharacterized protein LOC62_04G006307 [Vanrija pseudolonga]|uniref:Uncharacterized protein n=1 Tax=Vanrija pseudolonga TaxID=143232 RepID=A0AAF0YDG9_9TREE|nr:hypothetical protein LOC62_04G006307 [Vanrija pseudolonga]
MFIYNVHAPHKTFALAAKDGENCTQLIDRILTKARLTPEEAEAVQAKHDGAGIVYEFEGDRWALEDDDDLEIVTARFQSEKPPVPSITLHILPPAGSRLNGNHHQPSIQVSEPAPPSKSQQGAWSPPAYSSASALQARTLAKSSRSRGAPSDHGERVPSRLGSHAGSSVAGSVNGERYVRTLDPLTAANYLAVPNSEKFRTKSVRSGRSTRSRRSKWGDDDAEPLGDVKRRQFEEFHANNGVRTVVGKVGPVENVRMLLKQGHKGVYISRAFATRHGMIPRKQQPGHAGYSGLQMLGSVPITVGSRTAYHPAMLSEEQHFDVVLGRTWLERMNIKVDPLDQTCLTYMDTGETIPCDLVVLRDAKGEIITIT